MKLHQHLMVVVDKWDSKQAKRMAHMFRKSSSKCFIAADYKSKKWSQSVMKGIFNARKHNFLCSPWFFMLKVSKSNWKPWWIYIFPVFAQTLAVDNIMFSKVFQAAKWWCFFFQATKWWWFFHHLNIIIRVWPYYFPFDGIFYPLF